MKFKRKISRWLALVVCMVIFTNSVLVYAQDAVPVTAPKDSQEQDRDTSIGKPDETENPGGKAEQPDGTENPGGKTEQPDGAENPGGKTEQPDGAENPGGKTEQPDGAENPGGKTEQPDSGTERPDSEMEKPGNETEKSGGETGEPGRETEEPVSETGEPDSETEEPVREPQDWSSNPLFHFFEANLTQDGNSGSYELEVKFSFRNQRDEAFAILSGDRASFELPEEWLSAEDTKENEKLPVDYREKGKEEVSLGTLADYTIKNGRVEIIFNEDAAVLWERADVFGEVTIPVTVRQAALQEKEQTVDWKIQSYNDGTENKVPLLLPAKAEKEPKEAKAGAKETEKPKASQAKAAPRANEAKYPSAVTQDIYWQDNNHVEARMTAEVYRDNFYENGKLKYSYEIDGKTYNGEVAVKDVLTKEQLTVTDKSGTGHYVMNIPPNVLPAGGDVPDPATGEMKEVTFFDCGFMPPEVAGYYFVDVPDEETRQQYTKSDVGLGWYYLKEFGYALDITLRRGDNRSIKGLEEMILREFVFRYKQNGADDDFQATALEEIYGTSAFEAVVDEKNDIIHIKIKEIPQYRIDGTEREYHIEPSQDAPDKLKPFPNPGEESGIGKEDYFTVTYVNTEVSNHGTVTDKGYTGAEMILTLTGNTEYSGTKHWMDVVDNKHRPALKFGLWRYSRREGADYTAASQVKNDSGTFLKLTVPEGYSEEDSFTIDFTKHMVPGAEGDVLLAPDEELPKYDPEGYEYVYFVRESMGSSSLEYEKQFGEITMTGTELERKDTLPYKGERKTGDASIYNTGTVNNVLAGTVEAGFSKTWKAMSHQDGLGDVRVEFTLQAKHKENQGTERDNWYTAKDDEGNPIKQELSGFGEEKLTDSYSASMLRYDDKGHEMEYRWVETGVYQGKDSKENLLSEDKGTFTLIQNGKQISYTSELENVGQPDGTYMSQIVNRISDTVDYEVEKKWVDADGNETDAPEGARVTLELWRMDRGRNEKLTVFTMDGTVDSEKTPVRIPGEDTEFTEQEAKGWYAVFGELPKYDADGYKYDYIVLETNADGYTAVYNTVKEDDRYYTKIINRPGTIQTINVRKMWIDDGDEQHRGKVTFTIYERESEKHFKEIETVTLSSADVWWKNVRIADEISLENILVLETSVSYTGKDGKAEVYGYEGKEKVSGYTQEEMEQLWKLQHGVTPTEDVDKFYQSDEHYYQVTHSMTSVGSSWFYTVTNRRLGHLDIDVTKKWIDGDGEERAALKEELDDKGIQAYIKLSCDLEGAIDYGKGTINVGTGEVEISGGVYQEISLADGRPQKVVFGNLPKYTSQGIVVHYSISEVYAKKTVVGGKVSYIETTLPQEGISTDFVVSYEDDGYVVGDNHTFDTQNYTVINKLVSTKGIAYHKEWLDVYRKERNERPDIYLELYRLVHTSPKETRLELVYQEHEWNQVEEYEDDYHWTVNFDGLPKYDAYGYEIIYYAWEKMHVNGKNFDYIPVYYKWNGTALGNEEGGYYESVTLTDKENRLYEYGMGNQKIWLLKEDGTFVNQLENTVRIEGKKIWGNIPGGFEMAALPKITFQIYRRLASAGGNETGGEEEPYASLTITDWEKQYVNHEYKFLIQYAGVNRNTLGADGELEAESPDNREELPLYDERGNRYEYTVEEKFDLNGVNREDVYHQPVINNFNVQNYYDSDQGSLTVRKLLDLRELKPQENYPTVAFTLTRYYEVEVEGKKELKQDNDFQQEKKIPYTEFAGDKEGACTFKNLEIYAPDGKKFQYRVTETPIDGYEIKFAVSGDVEINQPGGNPPDTQDADSVGGLYADKDDSKTPDATFQNTKTDDRIVIEGTKIWEDGNNALEFRPTVEKLNEGKTITFRVTRYAKPQDGETNGIGSENQRLEIDADKYTITWSTVDGNLNQYRFMIAGKEGEELEKHAPNGTPWIYYIQEVVVPETESGTGLPGYVPEARAVKCTATASDVEVQKEGTVYTAQKQNVSVTNPLASGSTRVEKQWLVSENPSDELNDIIAGQMDADYLGYTMEVEFTLQARINSKYDAFARPVSLTPDEKQEWADTDTMFTEWFGLSDEFYIKAFSIAADTANQQPFITITFDKKRAGKFTVHFKGSVLDAWKWKATFSILPVYVKSAEGAYQTEKGYYKLDYRLAESKISYYRGNDKIAEEVIGRPAAAYDSNGVMRPEPGNDGNSFFTVIGRMTGLTSGWGNILPVTHLTVTKTWKDTNDAYGTRPLNNAKNKWETKFLIQRRVKAADGTSGGEWEDVYSYKADGTKEKKIITLTGEDTEASVVNTASQRVDNLPVYGWRQTAEGTDPGYERIEYEYRARELNQDGTAIQEDNAAHGYYGIYEVEYADTASSGSNPAVYSTEAVNSFIPTQRYAEKRWNGIPEQYCWQGSPADGQEPWNYPVTLELKYVDKDGSTLHSFPKAAQVTVDGEADDGVNKDLSSLQKPYGEYEAWKAIWKGVPEHMPDSAVDKDGKTIYKVVEISDGFYQEGPAEEKDGKTEEKAFVYTNTPTQLRISKDVDLGDTDEFTLDDREFTFVLTHDGEITGTCPAVLTSPGQGEDEMVSRAVEVTTGSQFKLKNGESLVIYGLPVKKADGTAIKYTVTEEAMTNSDGSPFKIEFDTSVKVNGGEAASGSAGTSTLLETEPETDPKVTSFAFTNTLEGAIHLEKQDEQGNPLKGVKFTIAYSRTGEEGSFQPLDETVCGNEELVTAEGAGETDEHGKLSFTELKLGYYYQITETAPDGKNGLKTPIIEKLPKLLPKSDTQVGDIKPVGTVEKDGKTYNVYTELSYTVINNSFTMPVTSGPGFFWPGLAGLLLAMAGCGYWMFSVGKKRKRPVQPDS